MDLYPFPNYSASKWPLSVWRTGHCVRQGLHFTSGSQKAQVAVFPHYWLLGTQSVPPGSWSGDRSPEKQAMCKNYPGNGGRRYVAVAGAAGAARLPSSVCCQCLAAALFLWCGFLWGVCPPSLPSCLPVFLAWLSRLSMDSLSSRLFQWIPFFVSVNQN